MPRLWVYKCNAKNQEHQASYGDWDDFFDDPGDGRWGGTWGIFNPASRKILLEEMEVGDLILAYQTDRRSAVGLCRVVDFVENDDGETEMVLEPVERFREPVDVLALKKADPAVKALRAFGQGPVQTLYETSAEEAKTLLKICRARTFFNESDEQIEIKETGAGFGDTASNTEVEKAAIEAVTEYYETRNWTVVSVEHDKIGYDLRCGSRSGAEHHVEVKGVKGTELGFIMTAGELNRATTDQSFRLAVVTSALAARRIRFWTGSELLDQFERRPIQFMLKYRGPIPE